MVKVGGEVEGLVMNYVVWRYNELPECPSLQILIHTGTMIRS